MNQRVPDLILPTSYAGDTSPAHATVDPYGYPIPRLHDHNPDSADDVWSLFVAWHDWGATLNGDLNGLREQACEFTTSINCMTHQAIERDAIKLSRVVTQFLLRVWELQFNNWIPNRSPFPTRSDISALVFDSKGRTQFYGERVAYDVAFSKAFEVAFVIENSFGFSDDMKQLKQKLTDVNQSSWQNAPWSWHRFYTVSSYLFELEHLLRAEIESQPIETRESDLERWYLNTTNHLQTVFDHGCGFDYRLNLNDFYADELAHYVCSELHDYPYREVATELRSEFQIFQESLTSDGGLSAEFMHNLPNTIPGKLIRQLVRNENQLTLSQAAELVWGDWTREITDANAQRQYKRSNDLLRETQWEVSYQGGIFCLKHKK